MSHQFNASVAIINNSKHYQFQLILHMQMTFTGRARSWSEKQRRQNLWTKRGYDLAYRACTCKCNRGHLRKDLNWNPKETTIPGRPFAESLE